jgi:hypothetical protein
MPFVVTSNAVITCIHGGTVTIAPRPGRMTIDGGTVLCEGDLVGAPIVGCPVVPSTNSKPCTTVVSTVPGSSSPKLMVAGRPAYVDMLQGVTDGVPPGSLKVVSAGQVRAAV